MRKQVYTALRCTERTTTSSAPHPYLEIRRYYYDGPILFLDTSLLNVHMFSAWGLYSRLPGMKLPKVFNLNDVLSLFIEQVFHPTSEGVATNIIIAARR